MKPASRPYALFALAVATLPLTGGCVWTPELRQIQQDIARQLPGATFDHEVSLSIGPGGMALARAAVAFLPGARDVRAWLKDVDRVEVAVYAIRTGGPDTRIVTPGRIESMLEDGWEMAARVRDDRESTWVLYRLDDDSIREVFVAALGSDELVLAKVRGRSLERLIARALTDIERRPIPGLGSRRDS